jgi:Thymidylate synthase complementing protein
MKFELLHNPHKNLYFLDHRIVPEVRAMLAAMVSRLPVGGIQQRYLELVTAVARSDGSELDQETLTKAEWRLCTYPLHPKVQQFFDTFVGQYGHSSVLELTGSPAVFSENISWVSAWLLFDSPLCSGQEFSTRAVQVQNWPIADELIIGEERDVLPLYGSDGRVEELLAGPSSSIYQPELLALHQDWLRIFEAEVDWWKGHLQKPENRIALGIGDKEPFRPALDRARWALPGTIATGCSHTSHLRERARVLKTAMDFQFSDLWLNLMETYKEALPGMKGLGLKESVYTGGGTLPAHLKAFLEDVPVVGHMTSVRLAAWQQSELEISPRQGMSYIDPSANTDIRLNIQLLCSIAAARDWHRHRTLYPWTMRLVGGLDPHYTPMSVFAKKHTEGLLERSVEVHKRLRAINPIYAACALPLGTRVEMSASGGLRDVLYMLELRSGTHGANFEYKDQAEQALDQLKSLLLEETRSLYGI